MVLYIWAFSRFHQSAHRRCCIQSYVHTVNPFRASVTRHNSRSTCHDANPIRTSGDIRACIPTEPSDYHTNGRNLQRSKESSPSHSELRTCSMFHHPHHAANPTMQRTRWSCLSHLNWLLLPQSPVEHSLPFGHGSHWHPWE